MDTSESESGPFIGSESQPAELTLSRRERFGRNLFDIGEAVIVTDPSGNVILRNQMAESLTGGDDFDAQNQPIEAIFRIIHEVTRQPVSRPVKNVFERGIAQNLDQFTFLVAKDGVERSIDDSASPLRGNEGNLEGVVLIFKDISERRSREKKVERGKISSEVVIAAIRDSLVVLDADLQIRSANQSFCAMSKVTLVEAVGRSVFELGGYWNKPGLREKLESSLENKTTWEDFPFEQVSPLHGLRAMVLNARKLTRDDGQDAMILVTIEDVTDRKWLKSSFLATSELKFRRLFEAAKDGILILDDENGAITDANPFLLKLLGYSHDEIVGKQLWEIGLLGDETASRASFLELQEKGYVRYDDLPLKTQQGRSIDVEVVSNVYRSGEKTVIQCNIRDITDRKRADQELKRAKEAAEEADRGKDLFLATLSHELRTPLTPVLATVEYLESKSDLSEEIRGALASIRRNVELEARLIDDLLDVTRIRQGKLELRREIIDLHVAARMALEFCQADIEAKKLEISLALRAENPFVWADPARLQQIFWNLLKNAVKFTPKEGTIRIRSMGTDSGRVAIDFSDTGAGIEPDALGRVFDLFEQGGRDVTRIHGGLGLGLAIAKMLVDLHGGSLTVESRGKNLGSVFRVELDQVPEVKIPDPSSKSSDGGAAAPSIKILLVEDNVDTMRAMTQLLRSAGFIVRMAKNVSEAMAVLLAERFNLLVSDIGLPDGSGLDIMRYGRENWGLKGIAFSGYGGLEDIAASKEAGFEHHLAKPSNLRVLIKLIKQTAA